MEKLNYKARAKINLALDVCRRLENGYHEIKTVMQSVNIYDELEFKRRRDPDIILSVDSRYELGDLGNNLIFRAAKFMKEYYGIRQGIEIHLKKTIPVAAGMAGGSTDAAATMLAMNEMFALKLDKEELMRQGLRLGADIPFCILGGTALAEGVGEKLTPLPAPPRASLLVVKPPIMVSTKRVYEMLCANEIAKHPDIDGMMAALEQGDIERVANYLENVMEAVTVKENSIIAEIKTMMTQQGAYNALMSGSGPSVFGIFAKEEEAQAAAKHIRSALKAKKMASQVFVTEFYNPF